MSSSGSNTGSSVPTNRWAAADGERVVPVLVHDRRAGRTLSRSSRRRPCACSRRVDRWKASAYAAVSATTSTAPAARAAAAPREHAGAVRRGDAQERHDRQEVPDRVREARGEVHEGDADVGEQHDARTATRGRRRGATAKPPRRGRARCAEARDRGEPQRESELPDELVAERVDTRGGTAATGTPAGRGTPPSMASCCLPARPGSRRSARRRASSSARTRTATRAEGDVAGCQRLRAPTRGPRGGRGESRAAMRRRRRPRSRRARRRTGR